MTWRDTRDHADATGVIARLLGGLVRRMSVTLSDSTLWQVLGQRGGIGGDETVDVENFSGIGFYSRPPGSGKPEAITVAVGGAKVTVVVATRDEATRAAMAGGVNPDETAVFNSQVMILVKADGTIEIGSGPGMESTIKADTYRAAEDTLFEAVATIINAIGALAVLLQTATPTLTGAPADVTAYNAAASGLPALLTDYDNAVIAFNAAIATYKTAIAKVR